MILVDVIAEYELQQRFSRALHRVYGGCIDGYIGFMDLPLGIGAPDIVTISRGGCDSLGIVTAFEVKTSLEWDHLGQVYRYSLYSPTYVVIPSSERVREKFALKETLRGLGIGVITIDLSNNKLNMVFEAQRKPLTEYVLYDAILWWIFESIARFSINDVRRVYDILVEFIKRGLRRVIKVSEIPAVTAGDRSVLRAIINILTLRGKALPIAENPLTVELLDLDIASYTPEDFLRDTLSSNPMDKVTFMASKLAELSRIAEMLGLKPCYVSPSLLMLYTKGLPLHIVGQSYDDICKRIYKDIAEGCENLRSLIVNSRSISK